MSPPRLFDPQVVRAHKHRARKGFAEAAFLHRRSAADLAERLEAIPRKFKDVLVLGCPELFLREISTRPHLAARLGALFGGDLGNEVRGVRIEHDRLSFENGSFDLIVSPLFLHWANDLPGALVQLRAALRPDGLLLASLFGAETLRELRYALLTADVHVAGGAGPRIAPFVDMREAAHLLQRAGLALPAADRDEVRVGYGEFLRLMYDLRAMGETSALVERSPRGLSRRLLAEAERAYRDKHMDGDNRYRATFEIITLTGWAPHEGQQKPLRPGTAKRRLAEALGVKERKADDVSER